MSKRIAVVTGGMGDIAMPYQENYMTKGIELSQLSRTTEAALAWQSEQKKSGYNFDIAYGDVTDFKSCDDMIKKIEQEIGPRRRYSSQ